MSKVGEMLIGGKIVVMDKDGIMDLKNFHLVVLDGREVHTRSDAMPIEAIVQGAIQAARGAEIDPESLTEFVSDTIKELYADIADE